MINGIEKRYRAIGRAIFKVCPKPFVRAVAYSEVTDDSWSAELFALLPNGDWQFLRDGLEDLNEEVIALRRAFVAAGEPAWGIASISLSEAGKFSIDFNYDDVSDPGWMFERSNEWRKKTIGEGKCIIYPD